MRVSTVLSVLAALVIVGVAGATTLDRVRVLPAPVTALDMTNQAVATATAWSPGHCEAVDLWSPDVRARYGFQAPGPCPATSTGRGIASVAVTYNRVLWLAYAGGNDRDWTLWMATRTAKAPKKLRFASAPVDAAPPIVLGNAGELEFAYAVGPDVVILSDTGARLGSWHAPARVVALSADGVGGVAMLLETGNLVVLAPKNGRASVVTDYDYAPGEVRTFVTVPGGVAVSTANDVELRTPAKTTPLGIDSGARVLGFSDGNLVYARGAEIRDYKRPSGDDVLLRHVKPPFLAEFDRRGLAWVTGRHVCFSVRMFVEHPDVHAPGC